MVRIILNNESLHNKRYVFIVIGFVKTKWKILCAVYKYSSQIGPMGRVLLCMIYVKLTCKSNVTYVTLIKDFKTKTYLQN